MEKTHHVMEKYKDLNNPSVERKKRGDFFSKMTPGMWDPLERGDVAGYSRRQKKKKKKRKKGRVSTGWR